MTAICHYVNSDFKPAISIDDVEFTLELIQDLKCIIGHHLGDMLFDLYKVKKLLEGVDGRNIMAKHNFLQLFWLWHDRWTDERLNKQQVDYLAITREVVA